MAHRVVIAEISHETNTFMPIKTGLAEFAERSLEYGSRVIATLAGTHTGIGGYIDAAQGTDVELIPAIAANAVPSGTVARNAFEHIVGHLIKTIHETAPGGIDGVALCLHGAMVADGFDDGEGEILQRVRDAVGPAVPVVATLDLHGNITEQMVRNADCLFGFDTNPHVDGYERAQEAFAALRDIWSGHLHPVMRMHKARMMPPTINMRTAEGPMVKLFERARQHESRPGVRNVSVFGGFPFADIEVAGLSVVALTDGLPDLADSICADIVEYAWSIRQEFLKRLWSPEEAVRHAMAADKGPVILADVADNMGGGGSGDTTVLLKALLDAGATGVGFAQIVDPAAAEACAAAGPGAEVTVNLGGKTEPSHGLPIQVTGVVRALTDGRFVNQGPMATGVENTLGTCAKLAVGGVEIIITSNRMAPNDPEIFRHIGIEPTRLKILVLKSRGHFRAAYQPFAAEILEVDCPGFASPNLRNFTYHKVRRPLFPLDEI